MLFVYKRGNWLLQSLSQVSIPPIAFINSRSRLMSSKKVSSRLHLITLLLGRLGLATFLVTWKFLGAFGRFGAALDRRLIR
jgi:hypothetical protein